MSKTGFGGGLGSLLRSISDTTENTGDRVVPVTQQLGSIYERLSQIQREWVQHETALHKLAVEEERLQRLIVEANKNVRIRSEVVPRGYENGHFVSEGEANE